MILPALLSHARTCACPIRRSTAVVLANPAPDKMQTVHRPLIRRLMLFVTGLLAALAFAAAPSVPASTPAAVPSASVPATENRFEKNVRDYEAADRASPPPKGAILLVGDSQFFRWKTLAADLPGYTVVNRGIDSLQMSDLLLFADRLVTAANQPRLIVLHVGGNDVHNGRKPEQVLADFQAFVAKARVKLPTVPIAFSSTTPGPARWDERAVRVQTNKLLKDYIGTQKNLHFIDLWDAMLTPDGKPREDLWVEDRIHPNQAGYQIRVKIMRPLLGEPDQKVAPTK